MHAAHNNKGSNIASGGNLIIRRNSALMHAKDVLLRGRVRARGRVTNGEAITRRQRWGIIYMVDDGDSVSDGLG